MSSFFGDIKKKEPDAVFNITTMFNEDEKPKGEKVNLGVGGKVVDFVGASAIMIKVSPVAANRV